MSPSSGRWRRGSFLAVKAHVCRPSERKRKKAGCSCSRVLSRSGLSHIACFAALCLPSVLFASLKILVVMRTLLSSKALRNSHRDSQRGPSISILFKGSENFLPCEHACDMDCDVCCARLKAEWTGDTDVDTGVEMAVGTLIVIPKLELSVHLKG